MLNRFGFLAIPLALVLPVAGRAQDAATRPAQDAALAWLALTDSGQYAPSWDQAARVFRASVPKATWSSAMNSVRAPLGALRGRKLKSATCTRSLPGAPDGEYVVIQYETQFQNRPAAVETVTPMHEPDGSWKVSGYFIK